jgi:hypothetical protein
MKKEVKINIEDHKYLKHHLSKYKKINNYIPGIEKIPNKARCHFIMAYKKILYQNIKSINHMVNKKIILNNFHKKINLHVLG